MIIHGFLSLVLVALAPFISAAFFDFPQKRKCGTPGPAAEFASSDAELLNNLEHHPNPNNFITVPVVYHYFGGDNPEIVSFVDNDTINAQVSLPSPPNPSNTASSKTFLTVTSA